MSLDMGRAATWMEEGEDIGLKGGNDQSYRGGILVLGAVGPWEAWCGLVLLPGGVQRCWSDTCACVHVPVNQGLRGPGVASCTSSAVQGDGKILLRSVGFRKGHIGNSLVVQWLGL